MVFTQLLVKNMHGQRQSRSTPAGLIKALPRLVVLLAAQSQPRPPARAIAELTARATTPESPNL